IFILLKENFWDAVVRVKNIALMIAFVLYFVRVILLQFVEFHPLTAMESYSWMISIFGYGAKFLNKKSTRLSYLSAAVYPIYIIHMPLQFFFSLYIIPVDMPAILKLILIIISTLISSFVIYDLIIKRLKWIRPLFGLKI
ncbi:MAG: acyltransferase, partial [Candidatus Neomarinimicrobiota bacterium]|nr:acyltransferase [Candidatus Neomarinimicrobiota bacterium]